MQSNGCAFRTEITSSHQTLFEDSLVYARITIVFPFRPTIFLLWTGRGKAVDSWVSLSRYDHIITDHDVGSWFGKMSLVSILTVAILALGVPVAYSTSVGPRKLFSAYDSRPNPSSRLPNRLPIGIVSGSFSRFSRFLPFPILSLISWTDYTVWSGREYWRFLELLLITLIFRLEMGVRRWVNWLDALYFINLTTNSWSSSKMCPMHQSLTTNSGHGRRPSWTMIRFQCSGSWKRGWTC